ncbi:hypothetical protein LCGC14_1062340 [marine sediment metagenome]|uniref:Uncharacterized protein n=1 Tax=marine sediment metagenome TaxID=412755 RepID=A0A0F9MQD5_9ZZZZ
MTDEETFKITLKDTLECLNRVIFLEKIGLLETAKFILFGNIIIGR